MERIKPGIYDGISDTDYHQGDGVSSSQLRTITRPGGPALLAWQMSEKKEDAQPKAFLIGRAAHSLVLGAGAPVVQAPDVNRRTKAGKAAYEEFKAGVPAGAIVLAPSDYETVTGMAEAVLANPDARALLEQPGKPEQSVYWKDEATGLLCKARPDYLPEADPAVQLAYVDYKTTTDASPHGFANSVAYYGYAQAAEYYSRGLAAIGYHDDSAMTFIVQEKTPPYLVAVYQLDAVSISYAHEANNWALAKYAECIEADEWPGYETIQGLQIPDWHIRSLQARGIVK